MVDVSKTEKKLNMPSTDTQRMYFR